MRRSGEPRLTLSPLAPVVPRRLAPTRIIAERLLEMLGREWPGVTASYAMRQVAAYARQRKRKRCEHCKATFMATPSQRFCGRSCYEKARRQRKRAAAQATAAWRSDRASPD